MATTKITDLTAYTDPVNTDVLPIVDVTSDVTKKVSIANVMKNASLGSNSAPGIAFDGDPNTGIYSPGADQVAVTTGGTQRLLIDSSGAVTIAGDLTVNGTTTNINTTNLVIEDKNIILGDVTTPTDVTADGGGITLKGTTDKTINWVDSTDAWTSSERFSYPLGSAAAPTLTFTGDANTGIYSPGADQVAISTNGTGRLFIDADGDVGIGVSNPLYALHVISASASAARIGNSGANNTQLLVGNSAGDTAVRTLSTGDGIIYSDSGKYLAFGSNGGTERMRLRSDGTFEIKGGGVAGTTPAVSVNTSASANSLVIDSSGRVGLGTSSPSSRVHCANAGAAGLRVENTTASITGLFEAGSSNLDFGTLSNNNLDFYTNGSLRARLDTSGRLGIGTTTVSAKLHIAGATGGGVAGIWDTAAGGARVEYKDNGTRRGFLNWDTNSLLLAADSGNSIKFSTNAGVTQHATIDSSGRLLVGTSSARNIFDNLYAPRLQVEGTDATHGFAVTMNAASTDGSYIHLSKSRSASAGGNAVVSSGDRLGAIVLQGADGAKLVPAARIDAFVDGTPGTDDMPGRLVFSTTADGTSGPTERMRIASNGKTTIKGSTSDSSAYSLEVTESGGIVQFTIRNDGVILTGTDTLSPYNNTTASAANLFVTSGGELQRSTSSIKYKRNVEDAVHGLTELLQLRPVTYQSKADSDGDIRYGGLIAEEVDSAGLSEFVQYAEDGSPDALAYGNMVSLCIKAIQEQQAVIEELQAKVAALEAS